MLRSFFLLLLSAMIVGCSGSGSSAPVQSGPTGKDAVLDLANLLKSLKEENRKPPGKLSELEPFEPMIPVAATSLRNGDLVYVWGTPVSSGTSIIAHEKKAATEGGWVLLQDGTLKEMTAAEFGSAPKVKK